MSALKAETLIDWVEKSALCQLAISIVIRSVRRRAAEDPKAR